MFPTKATPDFIYIKTPYEQKDFVSGTLNGVWSKSERMYRFPKNIFVIRELEQAFPHLRFDPTIQDLKQRLEEKRRQLLSIKAKEDTEGDPRLRPYQRVDVEYLSRLPCAGIFNEPRTGKTPTSIVLIQKLGTVSNLVVCPASVLLNWEAEFRKWAPEIKVFPVLGTPKRREQIYQQFRSESGQRVLVISKDTWKLEYEKWADFEFDLALVDEAHFLRALAGSRSKHTLQAEAILKIRAKRRYALTGTPTVKHTAEIYGILKFLYPTKFPSYWQFVERYFELYPNEWSGSLEPKNVKPHRVEELQDLIGFLSVQRKRKDVMAWLPPKQRIPFYVQMEGKQKKLYDQMVNDFFAKDGDVEVDTANVLAQLTRMRQLCLDPRLLGFDAPSAKTAALLEWLEDNPEPVVIMSMFTSYLHLIRLEIEKLGRKVGMITGEMTPAERQKTVQDFQEGRTDVVLCNIIAAGLGITLDRAETVVFTDLAWNPSDNEQAEDRITPTTEERNHSHNIIIFQCKDSVDERLNRLLQEKKTLTDIINEGGRKAIERLLAG